MSKDEAQRLLFWSGRKAAFPGGRPHLAGLLLHGRHDSAPGARRRCCARIEALSEQYGLRCANVFHAGDGNLHPLILYDANVAGESRARRGVRRRDPRAVHRGRRHDHRRARRRRREAAADVRAVPRRPSSSASSRVKAAFDAHGAAQSRARACPTLPRCAEFGKMHVHHGKLPHPDIAAFLNARPP